MSASERASMTAIAVVQQQGDLVVAEIEIPQLLAHQAYISVEYAAFNTTDTGLAFDVHAFEDGAVLGCDFVGTVSQIHPSVSKFQVGDKIAGLIWGGEVKGLGAFSTRCIADERIAFKVPDNIACSQACAIPLAINTAYLALFSSLSLGLPQGCLNSKQPLLIWGGSSVVGYFAIQLAKLHGYVVAATCSPHNFDYVKGAGASHVFDYRDPEVVAKVQNVFPELDYVFDTIGSVESSSAAAASLNTQSGLLCTVRPGKSNTERVPAHVTIKDVFVFTAFPKPHTYRGSTHWPVIPENHGLSVELYNKIPEFLSKGLVTLPCLRKIGRLSPETVLEAMRLNRAGRVSAEKLYFEVRDM